jgi:hypothetical protein
MEQPKMNRAPSGPRTTAEQHLHDLFKDLPSLEAADHMIAGSEDVRARLAHVQSHVLTELAPRDISKAFRVEYTTFVFFAAVNDPLIRWEQRLKSQDRMVYSQFEQSWMNLGALVYVERNFPTEALNLVVDYCASLEAGPSADCSWQAQSHALLTAYIVARARSANDQTTEAAEVLRDAWEWVMFVPKYPPEYPPDPLDGSGSGGGSNLASAPESTGTPAPKRLVDPVTLLGSLVRFYVVKEILYTRLWQSSFLSEIPIQALREEVKLALKDAKEKALAAGGTFMHEQLQTLIVLYLTSPDAINSTEYLVEAWAIGGRHTVMKELHELGKVVDTRSSPVLKEIVLLTIAADIVIPFYQHQKSKHSPTVDADTERLIRETVEVFRSASSVDFATRIKSALEIFAKRKERADFIKEFWEWLLTILEVLEDELFRRLSKVLRADLSMVPKWVLRELDRMGVDRKRRDVSEP